LENVLKQFAAALLTIQFAGHCQTMLGTPMLHYTFQRQRHGNGSYNSQTGQNWNTLAPHPTQARPGSQYGKQHTIQFKLYSHFV
jgi:hypothetical protein